MVFVLQQRGGGSLAASEFGNDSTTLILLLFVCDWRDYMKCQNHRDQSSYPPLYLGISARLASCVLQENICSGEKEETVSTEPPPSPPGLHIKTSHPSLLVPSNGFHFSVAQ